MGCNQSQPMTAKEAANGKKRKGPQTVAGTQMATKAESHVETRKGQTFLENLVHEEYRRAITEVYDLTTGKQLGKGGFGTVQLVTHRGTGTKYALKTVELSRVKDKKSFEFFMKEVNIMKFLDHPNIVRLIEVYQTPDYLFMVMDVYTGGNLLESYYFKSESDAATIVGKITNAIRYCHDKGIAHRDLKLDNVLLEHPGEGAEIKLVDFGLSALFESSKLEHDVVGTWIYMAPEVIAGSHFPTACDMWSVGVIAYLLLCGYPPFNADTLDNLKWQIRHGKYSFQPDRGWAKISSLAKNFIKRLLVRNPQERMSAAEAQHHPWLTNVREGSSKLDPQVIDNMKAFQRSNMLKKVALEVVARTMNTEQIRALELQFAKADHDGSGVISFAEFKRVIEASPAKWNLKSDEEAKKLFDAIDVDGTGILHFNDFLAATIDRHDLDEQRLRLAFDRLDFDSDGMISVSDLEITCGSDMTRNVIKKTIDELDANGDGMVDFSEFCVAMRRTEDGTAPLALATLHSKSMDESEVNREQLQEIAMELSKSENLSETEAPAAAIKRASFVKAAEGLRQVEERRASKIEPDALMAALAAARITAIEEGIDLEENDEFIGGNVEEADAAH